MYFRVLIFYYIGPKIQRVLAVNMTAKKRETLEVTRVSYFLLLLRWVFFSDDFVLAQTQLESS